jgi:tellurite methyltransferase
VNKSIDFFDRQFRQAPPESSLKLNPFEVQALPWVSGEVLDFGSGMGNLAFAAAAWGCRVTALDGSAAAVEHMQRRAALEGLPVVAAQADLGDYPILRGYDTVVCIGLLMFFDCATGWRVLGELQHSTRPGGCLVLNVLVQGTTFMGMFDADRHCLFNPEALRQRFAGWRIDSFELADFDAPDGTLKCFCTLIAHKTGTPPTTT